MSQNKTLEHFFNAIKTSKIGTKNSIATEHYVKSILDPSSSKDASTASLASEEKANFDIELDNVFKLATESLNKEGKKYNFSNAQKEAAKFAYILASDPKTSVNSIGKFNPSTENSISVDNNSYKTQSIGLERLQDFLPNKDTIVLASEKFGGQELNNIVINTVSLAVSAAAQDSFMELVFPMVVMDPRQSHMVTHVTYSEFGRGFKRFSGNGHKQPRHEMVLNMYKKELYEGDYIKLLPVVGVKANGSDDTHVLLDQAVFQMSYRDVEKCNIAPLRINKKVDLIGVSQTAADLANGVRDDSDVLDKTIKLNSIFLEGEVAGEKRYIKFDVSNYKGTTFSHRNDGMIDNVSVAFMHEMKINPKTAADFRPDFEAATKGKMFGDTAPDYILGVNVAMNIVVSIGEAMVMSSSGTIALTSVKTPDGALITDSADPKFKEAEALLEKVKVAGFLLDATVTNTNFRDKGIQGYVKGESYSIGIGLKSSIGLTSEIEIAKKEGNQSDYDLFTIEEQTVYIDQQMGGDAVTTLFNFIDQMRAHKEANTLEDVRTKTPSHHFIRPYFSEHDLDLLKIVDSLKSTERMSDIREAILNKIRFQAIKMDRDSNYRDAVKYKFKTTKRTLVAMCDTEIASILTANDGTSSVNSRIPLTNNIDLIVAESYYPEFRNKLILSYVTPEDNDKNVIPELNVGACVYSPMLNYTIDQKERSQASVKELHNILRFEHIINLPVFTVFHINNVDDAIEKISVHTLAK